MKLRLAALLAVASIVVGACGASATPTPAATTAPSASPAGASSAPTAAASAPAASSATGGASSISITRFGSYTPEFHPIYAEANQYLTYS